MLLVVSFHAGSVFSWCVGFIMDMYDRETEVIKFTLVNLLLKSDHEATFSQLEAMFEQCDFPKVVEIICGDAIKKFRESGSVDADILNTLMLAFEKMSGYKYVEKYISDRNQLIRAR